ncbi:MAG: hypothetical protein Q8T03_06640 [Bacteroidota bacterium]|nr:hypothetical protein [Bacteroidota bacterium]
MKTKFMIIMLVFKMTLTFSSELFYNSNNPESICLDISGNIQAKSVDGNDSYTAELLLDNKIIQQITIKDRRSFKFSLLKNHWYTIRISKSGYYQRLISICTDLPKNKNGLYKFHFDTELIPLTGAQAIDQDALDFPIAIINYDKDAEWFYYNEEYTANMKRQLYKPILARTKN